MRLWNRFKKEGNRTLRVWRHLKYCNMGERFYKIQKINIEEIEIRGIPKGRDSLSVIKIENGKYFPLYGSNVNRVKALIDEERKKAILPYDQFSSVDTLLNCSRADLSISNSENDRHILRTNLLQTFSEESRMINNAFGGAEIHHIVELNKGLAEPSRMIFKRIGVSLNDPINGIFLPDNEDMDNIYHGSLHHGKHSDVYTQHVFEMIKASRNIEDLIISLDVVKKELWDGKLLLK